MQDKKKNSLGGKKLVGILLEMPFFFSLTVCSFLRSHPAQMENVYSCIISCCRSFEKSLSAGGEGF